LAREIKDLGIELEKNKSIQFKGWREKENHKGCKYRKKKNTKLVEVKNIF
jgi:transcription initiation factor TFIID subunit TAF12